LAGNEFEKNGKIFCRNRFLYPKLKVGVVGETGPGPVLGIRNGTGRPPAYELAHETTAQRFAGKTSDRGRLMQLKSAPDNSLFQAFNAFGRHFGQEYWKACMEEVPLNDPGGFLCKPWREISPRPRDKTEALTLIRSVIEQHVGRLEELLAEHEEIEADEADDRYDRAALDCSPAFERHAGTSPPGPESCCGRSCFLSSRIHCAGSGRVS
jgi:hypothetical protein